MIFNSKHIVVIDDAPAIRTFLRISLEGQGAIFSEAENAHDGLELCSRVRPDMVVLDLGLPDRDGLDILPEILSCSGPNHPPSVIVLTVRKDIAMRDAAFTRGAVAYVTKPFIMDDLLDVMQEKMVVKERDSKPLSD
ncbi:MAG: response regulator [Rickettsiales bacterium]|nr:response regulator [Rickettsiales bacterium]